MRLDGITKSVRLRLLTVALGLLVVTGVGIYKIVHESPRQWAWVITDGNHTPDTTKRELLSRLEAVTTQDGVRMGALVPLGTFVKPDGSLTTITLVEGSLSEASIDPKTSWQGLGDHLLMINSVDQDQTRDGGLSGKIGAGCGLAQEYKPPLNRGDVAFHECSGQYHQQHGVDWVANVAIVVWTNPDSAKRPCWNSEVPDDKSKYQQCVAEDVTAALRNLFKELHPRNDIVFDAMVFPAIATGTGKLTMEAFYQILFDQLYTELAFAGSGRRLPRQIYLLAFSGWPPAVWSQTKNAVASKLSDRITDWKEAEHKIDVSDWASLTGVAGGLATLLLTVAVGTSFSFLEGDSRALAKSASPALLLGWFSASLGLITAFKPLSALLPASLGSWPQVISGFLVVFLCGPLLRAGQKFDSTIKTHVEQDSSKTV
jgi:hypothetical protein